ncbi:MAG TPA: hypothetical protein PLX89_08390 [Verrucomicrobiota bacterium]|nr:hypothetical protein [Verrucomicrobiales bacterium]HRI13009.1 hypothetical protein [Verrucomicrobiota bacterium]
MCSVTFWPKPSGYLLGMNRDESLRRASGLPPAQFIEGRRRGAHPSEPNGGTWISLNDRCVGFALINWYAIQARAPRPAISRGEIVKSLRGFESPESAADGLAKLPLERMDAFRLLGFFPERRLAREWRWNLESLSGVPHEWSPTQWCSSGFDEPTAQQVRRATFESMRMERDAGTLLWLRRLHGSHSPGRGPFSICMHRPDAATVSYTELDVGAGSSVMRYCSGPLCCGCDRLIEAQVHPARS